MPIDVGEAYPAGATYPYLSSVGFIPVCRDLIHANIHAPLSRQHYSPAENVTDPVRTEVGRVP